jgi:hypothetical protein
MQLDFPIQVTNWRWQPGSRAGPGQRAIAFRTGPLKQSPGSAAMLASTSPSAGTGPTDQPEDKLIQSPNSTAANQKTHTPSGGWANGGCWPIDKLRHAVMLFPIRGMEKHQASEHLFTWWEGRERYYWSRQQPGLLEVTLQSSHRTDWSTLHTHCDVSPLSYLTSYSTVSEP